MSENDGFPDWGPKAEAGGVHEPADELNDAIIQEFGPELRTLPRWRWLLRWWVTDRIRAWVRRPRDPRAWMDRPRLAQLVNWEAARRYLRLETRRPG